MTKSKILVKSKNCDFLPNYRNMEAESGFFIFIARLAFTKLRQAFVKTPILYYYDPKCHIWIKTNVSRYAINRILSQLILDDLG